MDKLEKIAINGPGEDRLRNSLPANDDSKIHRSEHLLAWAVNERFSGIANGMDEVVDCLASDRSLATIERSSDRGVEVESLVAEPCTPVELLDAIVSAFHDLANRGISRLGVISKLERHGDRLADRCGVLDHVDQDLVLARELDVNDLNVMVGSGAAP